MSEWNARPGNAFGLPRGLTSTDRIEYVLAGDETVRSELAGLLNWGSFADDGGQGRIERWRRVVPDTVTIAVGDVNGKTKGSGARANGGKPAVELIPAGIIGEYLAVRRVEYCAPEGAPPSVLGALHALGEFQMLRGSERSLYNTLVRLDHDGNLINEIAEVFDYGRHKYSAWNWARGMAWSIPIGCAIRHLLAMRDDPAAVDPESGKSHRGHVGCNIVMLLWFLEYYPEGDDRPSLPSA